jgi:hypothetical protein
MGFILGFITAIVLVFIFIWAKSSERKPQSNVLLFKKIKERGEADPQLREKLILMLGGDEEKAEKIVAKKRFGKGSKYSENYYWWLAIRELEQKQKEDKQ